MRFSRKYGVAAGLTMGASLMSGVWVYAHPNNNLPAQWRACFDLGAVKACFELLLLSLTVEALPLKCWFVFFEAVAVINAILICSGFTHGILMNASMSGCFSAALYPLFFRKIRVPIFSAILIPLSVILAGQSLPIAVMFFTLGVFLIMHRKWKLCVAAILFSLAIGYAVAGHELFVPSGRTSVWLKAFQFTREYSNYITGTGLGSFIVIGPMLTKDTGTIFTWMHSDWLQILFEQGIIGFSLVCALYISTLRVLYNNTPLLLCLVAYGAFAVADMPFRYSLAALYGLFLLRLALEKRPTVANIVATRYY